MAYGLYLNFYNFMIKRVGVLSVGDYGSWSVFCLSVFTEHLLCVKARARQSVPPGSPRALGPW